jgi:hypothetical protein
LIARVIEKLSEALANATRHGNLADFLEGVDDQLTDPVDVAKSVLRAEKVAGNDPDESERLSNPPFQNGPIWCVVAACKGSPFRPSAYRLSP